jgi:hypothetical protein
MARAGLGEARVRGIRRMAPRIHPRVARFDTPKTDRSICRQSIGAIRRRRQGTATPLRQDINRRLHKGHGAEKLMGMPGLFLEMAPKIAMYMACGHDVSFKETYMKSARLFVLDSRNLLVLDADGATFFFSVDMRARLQSASRVDVISLVLQCFSCHISISRACRICFESIDTAIFLIYFIFLHNT